MLERLIVIGLLFAFTGAHTTLVSGPWPEDFGPAPDQDLLRMVWIPLYVPIGILILWYRRPILELVGRTPGLALLVVMCAASVLWSTSPDDTLRRSLALVMTVGFGYYLAARFDARELLWLLGYALTLATALSLAFAVIVPEVGVMRVLHPGAWRGLFANKNAFAQVAALNLLVLALLVLLVQPRPWWLVPACLVSGAALGLAQSMTPALAAGAGVAGAILLATLRAPRPLALSGALLAIAVAVVGSVLLWHFADDVLATMGRDSSLTGRSWLWEMTWDLIARRPMLGYGYGAFWTQDYGPSLLIDSALGWSPGSAHNGYLDLWLQLGLVGLTLFAWSLLAAAATLATRLRGGDPVFVYGAAALLGYVAIQNLAESQLLQQNSLASVLYGATLGLIAREYVEAGRRCISQLA